MVVLLLLLCFCLMFSAPEGEVVTSLGKVSSKEFYSSGGFQDFTDYGIYRFADPKIEENEYLKPMTEEDLSVFFNYLEDFEGWVGLHDHTEELYLHYDFDFSIVDVDDYFYLYTNPEYPAYGTNNICGSYNLYFFDVQSQTLYYFHNNI